MIRIKTFLFFTLLFALSKSVTAQNIQGTWEGYMNDELLRVSIEQKGRQICGFTHDYVLKDSSDNCTAAYSGEYLSNSKTWLLKGTRFIKNSGTHVLMLLLLWQDEQYGVNRLRGRVTTDSSLMSLSGYGSYDIMLKRVSIKPIKLPGGEPNCFPKPVKLKLPTPKPVAAKQPQKPATTKPVAAKPVLKPVVNDTLKKAQPSSPIKKVVTKPEAELVRKMTERKQNKQSTLEVSVKQINLKVYDNGDIDNDTVSIFYNGKLLLSHQRLSDKPIVINLDLDENVTTHTLTMYAENLGSIPPNTALIVVTAGDKRYELRSKASLEENAVLIFEYKPK